MGVIDGRWIDDHVNDDSDNNNKDDVVEVNAGSAWGR